MKNASDFLKYDPETGVILWVASRGTAKAGSEAGCVKLFGGLHYRHIKIFGRSYLAHRLAWLLHHGEWPTLEIDHINGDGTDNRIANLRLATRSQNNGNSRLSSRNTSGVKGVSWSNISGKWLAKIRKNGKHKHIGFFDSLDDAAAARKAAAGELFGEFAREST